MVNPVLTILFDLFLIGGAAAIIAGMAAEAVAARRPGVGASRPARRVRQARPAARTTRAPGPARRTAA